MSRNDAIRTALAIAEPAHCAFDRCQAGGIILERAPRVSVVDLPAGVDRYSIDGRSKAYHPGCYVAWLEEPPF